MSTVKATNFQHPSASDVGIQLGSDGSVVLPQGFTGGIGSNVVQTIKTDTFSTTSSSFVDVTGVSATITPSANTSKILVTVTGVVGNSGVDVVRMILVRNATNIALGTGGVAPQNTQSVFTAGSAFGVPFSISFLDSPATASAVTYKLTAATPGGTSFFGRNGAGDVRSITSITCIEVAA